MSKFTAVFFTSTLLVLSSFAYAVTPIVGGDDNSAGTELDAETKHYEAELKQLGFSENEVNGMVYGFSIATPELREDTWDELEQYKAEQAETNLAELKAEIETEQAGRGKNYDAETLRYSEALEQAGYSPAEVSGMTEIFAPAPAVVRKAYWDALTAKQ
jgi:Holliday junction resolvasome RuvABC DNA-binding subunit